MKTGEKMPLIWLNMRKKFGTEKWGNSIKRKKIKNISKTQGKNALNLVIGV